MQCLNHTCFKINQLLYIKVHVKINNYLVVHILCYYFLKQFIFINFSIILVWWDLYELFGQERSNVQARYIRRSLIRFR